MRPIIKVHEWIDKEKLLGTPDPDQAVLATVSREGIAHSRVVDLREITESGILFFSHKETKKVTDLMENPCASMTIWLPL